MCLNSVSIFIFLFTSVVLSSASAQSSDDLEYLSEDNWDDFIQPFRGQRSTGERKSDENEIQIMPTPELSTPDSSTSDMEFTKPVMTVTATRIGTSRYFHPGTLSPHAAIGEPSASIIPSMLSTTSETSVPISHEQGTLSNEAMPEETTPLDKDYTSSAMETILDEPVSTLASNEAGPDSTEILQDSPRPQGDGGMYFPSSESSSEGTPSTEDGKDIQNSYSLGKELERQLTLSSLEQTLREQGIPLEGDPALLKDEGPVSEMPTENTQSSQEIDNTDPTLVPIQSQEPEQNNMSSSERPTKVNSTAETVTVAESDSSSEIVEQLPRPVALVSETNEIREPPRLEDEFAEAFARPNPSNKKRRLRPGPGTKRKVRMRVRKLSNSNSFNGENEAPQEGNTGEDLTTPRGPKRYRSSTTPVPDPSPPTIHPAQMTEHEPKMTIVVKQGMMPLILKSEETKLRFETVTPQPQIERPSNANVEQINTYFPSPVYPKPKVNPGPSGPISNETSKEWLQSSNSKRHDIQHEEELFGEDRDNWEKNYMNLQQNSFYGASPEDLGRDQGQTLVSLNRKPRPDKRGRHEEEREAEQRPSVPMNGSPSGPPIVLLAHEDSHEGHHHPSFGLREENTRNDLIDITTSEPEPMREFNPNRAESPPFHHDTALEPEPNHFHESQVEPEIEIIPVTVHEEQGQEYYAIQPTGPEAQPDHQIYKEVPIRSHYDRNKQMEAQQAGELVFNEERPPNPPRRDEPRIRHRAEVGINMKRQRNPQNQEIPNPKPPQGPRPDLQFNPFHSHEFMGFGSDQHFDPEKIHNKLIPENESNFRKSLTSGRGRKKQEDQASNQFLSTNQVNPFNPQSNTELLPSPQNYGFAAGNVNMDKFRSPPFPPAQDESQRFDPNRESNNPRRNDPRYSQGPQGPQGPHQNQNPQKAPFVPLPKQLQDLGSRGQILGPGQRGILPYEGKSPNLNPYPNRGESGPSGMGNNQMTPSNYQQQIHRGPLLGSSQFPSAPAPQQDNRSAQDPVKAGDFSKAHGSMKLGGNGNGDLPTNSITLPMPGLVSIPTPPPESYALNEIYANRHYPPHTHSIATKPDYEPANPPLLNGHPLQYHFDPFIQNAGQFNGEKPGSGQGQHLNEFNNFNGAADGAYTRQHNQASPYNPYTSNDAQPYPITYDEDLELDEDRPRKKRKKKLKTRVLNHHYDANDNHVSSDEHEYDPTSLPQHYNSDQTYDSDNEGGSHVDFNLPPNQGGSQNYKLRGPSPSSHLNYEGESREKGYRPLAQRNSGPGKPTPAPHLYSDNAYVLMFPNMVPEDAMLPPKPFINGKQIPVISANSDLGEQTRGGIMSPGFHAAKVHPREQMLQVLASNHYNMEMEKYMEMKRRPPLPIHTPYGLLIPMGTGGSGNEEETHGHGHQGHLKGLIQGLHQNGHLVQVGVTKNTPFGNLKSHKNVAYKGGRITASGGIKASASGDVEPALELLAEKLAYKLGRESEYSDYNVVNYPPNHFYQNSDGTMQMANNNEGSYSEHSPISMKKSKGGKSRKTKSKPSKSNPQSPNPQSPNPELKSALKDLLKERLYEMLAEAEEGETKEVRNSPIMSSQGRPPKAQEPGSSKPGRTKGGNRKPSFPTMSMAQPSIISTTIIAPPRHRQSPPPTPPPASETGFLQTLKRFFSFSRQPEPVKKEQQVKPYHYTQHPLFNLTRNTDGRIEGYGPSEAQNGFSRPSERDAFGRPSEAKSVFSRPVDVLNGFGRIDGFGPKDGQNGFFNRRGPAPAENEAEESSAAEDTEMVERKGVERMLRLLFKAADTTAKATGTRGSDESMPSSSKSAENIPWTPLISPKASKQMSYSSASDISNQRQPIAFHLMPNSNKNSRQKEKDEQKFMDSHLYEVKNNQQLGTSPSSAYNQNQLLPNTNSKNTENTNENESILFNFI